MVLLTGKAARSEEREPPLVRWSRRYYEALLRRIGRGSYGEVWLARNAVGTLRAVKVIYRANFADVRPYEREFTGIQKYEPISRSNEGLVDILQIGRNESAGYFYYVMELADDAGVSRDSPRSGPHVSDDSNPGGAVETDKADFRTSSGIRISAYEPKTLAGEIRLRERLTVKECIELGLTLNLALGHLHARGLIHRDVKPSNIIFVSGVPKLADVGLVSDIAEAQSFVGTEGFVPPEGPNSPQADLYALGKTLYEACMAKDRHEFPEPFTEVRAGGNYDELMELNEILLRACAPNPKDRYSSAEQMNADLALLHSGQSVRARYAMARRLKMMTRLAAGIAAVMALGVAPYTLALKEAARATRAEAGERNELYKSYIAQIRAGRFSPEAGRKRFAGLELVSKAAKIRPSPELRNEAIACLASPDMHLVKELSMRSVWGEMGFLQNLPCYAASDEQGNVTVRGFLDDAQLAVLPGFGSRAGAQFSPDGTILCTADGGDHPSTPHLWDLRTRAVLFSPPIAKTRCFRFAPDGKRIAIAQQDGAPVILYEIPSGKELGSFPVESLPWDVALDAAGNRLAVSCGRNVVLYDVVTGQIRATLPHKDVVLTGLDFSPDGETLAVCADHRIELWNTARNRLLAELPGHDSLVPHALFNHDGRLLASTSWDGRIRMWSMGTLKELCYAPMSGYSIGFSQNGRWLANDGSGVLRLFEVNPADELRLLRADASEHQTLEYCDFSADDHLLAAVYLDRVWVWDVDKGKKLASVSVANPRDVVFNPATQVLFTSGSPGIQAWPFGWNGSNFWIGPAQPVAEDADFCRNAIARNGENAVLVRNGRLLLLDVKTKAERLIAGTPRADPRIRNLGTLQTDPGGVPAGTVIYRSACISSSGKWCAADRFDTNLVEVFDTRTSRLIHTLVVDGVRDVVFSSDERWLVTCDIDDYRFWDTSSWRSRIEPHGGGFSGPIAFCSDGTAAMNDSGCSIRLIDPETGKDYAKLEGDESQPAGWLAFSHDGRHLASVGAEHPAQLWNLGLIRKELAEMNLNWSPATNRDTAPTQ